MAESLPRQTANVLLVATRASGELPRQLHAVRPSRRLEAALGRAALLAVVFAYLGSVLLGPLLSLACRLAQVGAVHVAHALLRPDALAALRMSLGLAVVAAAVNAVVGTLGALALTRQRFVGRKLIDMLVDLPLGISPVMVGVAFALLVGHQGYLHPLLQALAIKVLFAFPGLLIATLFVTLPYTLRQVAYVLDAIGTSEEEAAATLGASPSQTFFRITLPNLRVALAAGVLMTVARSLGEFGAVLVLGGSISGKTQTATTFIHDAIEGRDSAGAYGMAAVLALCSLGLWLVLRRFEHGGRTR